MFSKSFNDLFMELESLTKRVYVSEEDKENFRKLLAPANWDFSLFEKALAHSALLNIFPYTTPDTISLDRIKSFIDRLRERTSETGNEHARSCFANIAKKKLIFGKTTMGDKHSCPTNQDTPAGANRLIFKFVMSIHTHPPSFSGAHFSGTDFIGFLHHPEAIANMVICNNTELLTLKTFRTPKLFDLKNLKIKVNGIHNKFLANYPKLSDIINFTKEVCADNYLSLYIIKSGNGYLAEKINL